MTYAEETARAVSEIERSKQEGITYEMAINACEGLAVPTDKSSENEHYEYFLNVLRRARELKAA